MQARLLFLLLLFGCVAPAALPATVYAEDEAEGEDFDTFHIGLRVGAWYRPEIDFRVKAGGVPRQLAAVFPTSFDAERDLSIRGNPRSEYLIDFDASAILELEPFIHTRFVNLSVQWIAPFEYKGEASLDRNINFGGAGFTVNDTVEAKFRQAFFGLEAAINIFNNQYFRISPVAGIQALGIDWEVRRRIGGLGGGIDLKGDTSDIDSPMQFGEWQVFPFPELGFDVAVGYRSLFEVNLKVLGAWVDYFDYEGSWFKIEANATVWPIKYIGIQLGYRYVTYDFKSRTDDGDETFSFDLDFSGVTFALIVRL